MMKITRLFNPAVLVVAFLFASIAFSSCYKEPFYKCKVIVIDSFSTPVPGALVKLSAPVPGATVRDSAETDGQGQVSFEFANEAVFEVAVTKGALSGDGFIKLENRETVIETVTIQ